MTTTSYPPSRPGRDEKRSLLKRTTYFPQFLIHGLLLTLITLSCFLFYSLNIESRFEHKFYDWRMGMKADIPINSRILLIQSTKEDVEQYNKKHSTSHKEIPLKLFTKSSLKALQAGAHQVVYFMNHKAHDNEDPSYQTLQKLTQTYNNKILIGTTYNQEGLLVPKPFLDAESFAWQGFAVYHSQENVRSAILEWKTIAGPVTNLGSSLFKRISGLELTHEYPTSIVPLPFIYKKPFGYYFHYNQKSKFPTVSISEFLDSSYPKENLKNKYLFIGSGHQPFSAVAEVAVMHPTPNFDLFHETPMRSKAEIWAWALNTMIMGKMIIPLSKYYTYAAAIITILLTYVAITNLHLILATLIVLIIGLLLWFFSTYLLSYSMWLNITTSYFFMLLTYFIATFYRITRQMEITWLLTEQLQATKEISSLKSNFMNLISKDLANFSEQILSEAQALGSKKERLTEMSEKALGQTLTSSREFDTYIRNIIAFSSFESETPQISLKPVPITECVTNIADQFSFKLTEKNIELEIYKQTHYDLAPLGDQHIIEQILSNLLGNAIKYSPSGTLIEIHIMDSARLSHITFRDQGPGIPMDYKEKIFEKFYRIKNDDVYTVKGTGLGLFLVKYLLSLHQGDIFVTDNDPGGSVFHVLIPHKPSIWNPMYLWYLRKKLTA